MSRFSRYTNNIKVLQQELKSIKSQPLEGFRIEDNEDDIFKWNIGVFGPPGTIYEGGYFKGKKNKLKLLLISKNKDDWSFPETIPSPHHV